MQKNPRVNKEFDPEHSIYQNEVIDSFENKAEHIPSLTFGNVVCADEMQSNQSESNQYDSGGDLESFVQDSQDSNDYDDI